MIMNKKNKQKQNNFEQKKKETKKETKQINIVNIYIQVISPTFQGFLGRHDQCYACSSNHRLRVIQLRLFLVRNIDQKKFQSSRRA